MSLFDEDLKEAAATEAAKPQETKEPSIDEVNTMLSEAKEAYIIPAEKAYPRFPEGFSPTIGKLAKALSLAQGAVKNVLKEKEGYGYKYVDLGSLIDACRDALANNELAIIQTHELVRGDKPTVVTHTTLAHSSGEWMRSSLELPLPNMPQLSPAQVVGVAATYARRYSLQALMMVAGEDDTDGTAPVEIK